MDYRFLGASGLKVPVLSLGTGTFGGRGELFSAWGHTDVAEAHAWSILPRRRAEHVRLRRRSTPTGPPRRFSARPSRAAATRCSSPPRPPSATVRPPTRSARRATTCSGRSTAPAPARHRLHRPVPAARLRRADAGRGDAAHARRPGARPARSATSAARTSPAGT